MPHPAPARLAYHLAVADTLRAARDLLSAAVRLDKTAREADPDGQAPEDPAVMMLVADLRLVMELTSKTSTGMRQLMAEALTATFEPDAPPAAAPGPQEAPIAVPDPKPPEDATAPPEPTAAAQGG